MVASGDEKRSSSLRKTGVARGRDLREREWEARNTSEGLEA